MRIVIDRNRFGVPLHFYKCLFIYHFTRFYNSFIRFIVVFSASNVTTRRYV